MNRHFKRHDRREVYDTDKSKHILNRAVKNIRSLQNDITNSISVKGEERETDVQFKDLDIKKLSKKLDVSKLREKKVGEKKFVLYLKHIPYGFYEDEMRQYFKQFGKVKEVKMAKKIKTGRSRGYAFIDFEHSAIANIAAETMNNYIISKKVLKASVVPKYMMLNYIKKERKRGEGNALINTNDNIMKVNKSLTKEEGRKRLVKRMRKLDKLNYKLKQMGITYRYKPNKDSNVSNKEQISETERRKMKDWIGNTIKTNDLEEHLKPFKCHTPVLEIDESDEEIQFTTPPNVIKRKLSEKTRTDTPVSKDRKPSQRSRRKEWNKSKARNQNPKVALNST